MADFKCGYVAIIGRPNVGKSSLLNALIGENLAIVTPKPQTTRHRITGILNQDDAQIIFLDTPGYHSSSKPLNQMMNEVVDSVIKDADCVCLILEAGQEDTEIERGLFDRIGRGRAIIVLNKCDLIDRTRFEPLALKFKDGWGAQELVVLSAKEGFGVQTLAQAIKERLPEGPALFPADTFAGHTVRFIAAELIREQVFLQTRQEIPYSTAVVIEEFKDASAKNPVTRIRAAIVMEKESQKGMVVGKGGARIKAIGTRSREKIEELVGGKVYLDLNVRVEKDWTKDREIIKKLGGAQ